MIETNGEVHLCSKCKHYKKIPYGNCIVINAVYTFVCSNKNNLKINYVTGEYEYLQSPEDIRGDKHLCNGYEVKEK